MSSLRTGVNMERIRLNRTGYFALSASDFHSGGTQPQFVFIEGFHGFP